MQGLGADIGIPGLKTFEDDAAFGYRASLNLQTLKAIQDYAPDPEAEARKAADFGVRCFRGLVLMSRNQTA